ncbi:MAG: zinc-ribbon domain containing protein [Firmicutes bacterium]|nr:zinc-ribbon domain containing protein [Bacillota bacterium]
MAFEDKVLNCRDCGQDFVFTAGEQQFYVDRGFQNEPSRCPDCRRARKAARVGTSGTREMFEVTCSACGKPAMVPFQPSGDRPVYCSECFAAQRAESHSRY